MACLVGPPEASYAGRALQSHLGVFASQAHVLAFASALAHETRLLVRVALGVLLSLLHCHSIHSRPSFVCVALSMQSAQMCRLMLLGDLETLRRSS